MQIIDFEGQYCNRNCIGCGAFSLATARLFCYKSYKSLRISAHDIHLICCGKISQLLASWFGAVGRSELLLPTRKPQCNKLGIWGRPKSIRLCFFLRKSRCFWFGRYIDLLPWMGYLVDVFCRRVSAVTESERWCTSIGSSSVICGWLAAVDWTFWWVLRRCQRQSTSDNVVVVVSLMGTSYGHRGGSLIYSL